MLDLPKSEAVGDVAVQMFKQLNELASAGYEFKIEPCRNESGDVIEMVVSFRLKADRDYPPHLFHTDRWSLLARLPYIIAEFHEKIFPVPPVPDAFLNP